VLPLSLLDDAEAGPRLAAALAARERQADARTVSRELSALRSAAGWWQDQGWLSADPTAGLRTSGEFAPVPPLTDRQLAALFALPARLREQAFWHLLSDTGVPAHELLGLDATAVDLAARLARPAASAGLISYGGQTSQLLGWLLAGRAYGPVFLTDRRAGPAAARADVCPLTWRNRMSYRRAAELFTGWTRQLDPTGHGWTLHQLRRVAVR
jgi:integrase